MSRDEAIREQLNEYLHLEFGGDPDDLDDQVTADWPFNLTKVGEYPVGRETCEVFAFRDGDDAYLAVTAPALCFYPTAGMSASDLALQQAGASWLKSHEPLDLYTSWIDDSDVPSTMYRKARLHQLAREALSADEFTLREGLYLRSTREYVGLAELPEGRAFLVSERFGTHEAAFPDASEWRRRARVIGERLRDSGER